MLIEMFALLAGTLILALHEGQLSQTSNEAGTGRYLKDIQRVPLTAAGHLLLVVVALAGPLVFAVSDSCGGHRTFADAISPELAMSLLLVSFAWIPVEELVFRGAALGFLRLLVGEAAALYVQAALFACAHYLLLKSVGSIYLVVLFLLGLLLGWMRVSYMSLIPGAIVHAAYNLAIAAATVLTPALVEPDGDCRKALLWLGLWIVPVVVLALVLLLIGSRQVVRALKYGSRVA